MTIARGGAGALKAALLDHALDYARRGLPVFPCDPATKRPLAPRDKDAAGRPIPKTGGFYKATTEEGAIREMWRRYPHAMIGVQMGPEAGVFALDPDTPKQPGDPDGLAAWIALAEAHGFQPRTHTHLSPRGGRHLLFAYPVDVEVTNSPGRLPPGIDVRGAGGYVIAPPSRTIDGREYRLEEPEHAFQFEEAPTFLLELLRKPEAASKEQADRPRAVVRLAAGHSAYGESYVDGQSDRYVAAAVDRECSSITEAGPGRRNNALNRAAFSLGTIVGAGRLDAGAATRALLSAAAISGLVQDDGQHAVLRTIESGLTSGAAHPREMPEPRGRAGAPLQNREERRKGSAPVGDDEADDDSRPIIQVLSGEIPQAVREAEAAVLAAGAPIYARAGSLVRPVVEEVPSARGRMTTVARFRPMCAASLADHAARVMRFQKYDGRAKDFVTVNPPSDLIAAWLTRDGEWGVPTVSGIITTPTLRPDGSILAEPGYDPETRLFLALDRGLQLPAIPEWPTRDDAVRALRLLEELLSGFPFVGQIDHSVALSGILTAVVRGAIPVAPLHAVSARTAGTGKSFLVDIASMIATGRCCPVIAAGRTEEETEKRLGALLRDAVPVISIDNVNGELGGDALCQMTERPLVRIRVLGRSEAPELECRSTTFATGNNLVLVGDMTRRTVICQLDAAVERPELRTFGFDPVERIVADRGAYVAAALTIVLAYRAAGAPPMCGPVGSYTGWSETVRAPLIWLGHADPALSMEKAREEDPELSAMRELFAHWREHLQLSSGYTTNTVIRMACEKGPGTGFDYSVQDFTAPEFRDLLLRQAGDGGVINSRRLGKWLSRISGRIVDGYRLEMKADGSHGNRFALLLSPEAAAAEAEAKTVAPRHEPQF